MLIGIDASRAISKQPTGVEYYSKYLIEGLIEKALSQTEHQVVLYGKHKLDNKSCPVIPAGKNIREFFSQKKKIQVAQRIIQTRRLWTQIGLSRELAKNPPDVLFVPSHVVPRFMPRNIKVITTIHDIAFMHLTHVYSPWHSQYLRYTTNYALKRAQKIITPSQATKADIVKTYTTDPKKITVIPHGPPQNNQKNSLPALYLEKIGLNADTPFFLHIGRLEEKKNIVRTIKAFARFADKHKIWRYVLSGQLGVGFKKIINTIMESPYRERIILTGYVDWEEKELLYKKSQALIVPSLYEGFGLPILEAFQYNLPVIAANCTSLPEVCGQKGAYFIDPFDEESILQAMEQVAFRQDLRDELIQAGKKQIKIFSWKKTTDKTWEVLV